MFMARYSDAQFGQFGFIGVGRGGARGGGGGGGRPPIIWKGGGATYPQ